MYIYKKKNEVYYGFEWLFKDLFLCPCHKVEEGI